MSSRWMSVLKRRQADLSKVNATCQRCLDKGHWTYECDKPQKYVKRMSRTQELKRKIKLLNKGKKVKGVIPSKKARKKLKESKKSSSSSSSSNSSSSSSSSSSDSSSSDSSDSDSGSSSSTSSSSLSSDNDSL